MSTSPSWMTDDLIKSIDTMPASQEPPPIETKSEFAFGKPLLRPEPLKPTAGWMTDDLIQSIESAPPPPPPPNRGVLGDLASSAARGAIVGIPQFAGQAVTGLGALTGIEPVKQAGRAITGFAEELPEKFPSLQPSAQEMEGGLRRTVTGTMESIAPVLAASKAGAMIGSVVPGGGTAIGAIAGGLAGLFGTFGLAGKGRAYEEAIKAGKTEEEAQSYSNKIGAIEGGVWSLLGPVEAATGGIAGKFLKKPAVDTIKKLLTPTLAQSAVGMGINIAGVTGAGAASSALQARAAREAGLPGPTPEEAAMESIGPSIGMSVLFGLASRGWRYRDRQAAFSALKNPTVDPEYRVKAASKVYGELWKIDPELANSWLQEAGYKIGGEFRQEGKSVRFDSREGLRPGEIPIDTDYMAWMQAQKRGRIPAMWGTPGGGLPVEYTGEEMRYMGKGRMREKPPELTTGRMGRDFYMSDPWVVKTEEGTMELPEYQARRMLPPPPGEKPVPRLPYYPPELPPGAIQGEGFTMGTGGPPAPKMYKRVSEKSYAEVVGFESDGTPILGKERYSRSQIVPEGATVKTGTGQVVMESPGGKPSTGEPPTGTSKEPSGVPPSPEIIRGKLRSGAVEDIKARVIYRPVGSTQGLVEIDGQKFVIDNTDRLSQAGVATSNLGRKSTMPGKTQKEVNAYLAQFPKLGKEDFPALKAEAQGGEVPPGVGKVPPQGEKALEGSKQPVPQPVPDDRLEIVRAHGKAIGGVGVDTIKRAIGVDAKTAESVLKYLESTGEIEAQPGGGKALFPYKFVEKPVEQKTGEVKAEVPLPEGASKFKGHGILSTKDGWEVHGPEGKIGVARTRDLARDMINKRIEEGKTKLPGETKPPSEETKLPPEETKVVPGETVAEKKVTPERTQEVITQGGIKADTKFRVVEADDLIVSHGTDFEKNPAYNHELQERPREKAASQNQIRNIIAKFDPEQIAESRNADTGAPIIGSDMMVESGNGRAIAVKTLYKEGNPKGEAYKKWLQDNASRFGVDAEELAKMKNPILVRERTTSMEPKQRIEFARDANRSKILEKSAEEKARDDAERLTVSVMNALYADEGGNLTVTNPEFVRRFLAKVPANEMSDYLTQGERGDAKLSNNGILRIKHAIFAKAYGDKNAGDLLRMMTEDPDNNVKTVINSMLTAAPDLAIMRMRIDAGERLPLDISASLSRAANTLSELRRSRTPLDQYMRQENFFGKDPVDTELLKIFNDFKREPSAISDVLKNYVWAVDKLGNPKQKGLFGSEKPPSKLEILEAARRVVEEQKNAEAGQNQKGLFPPPDKGVGGEGAGKKNEREKYERDTFEPPPGELTENEFKEIVEGAKKFIKDTGTGEFPFMDQWNPTILKDPLPPELQAAKEVFGREIHLYEDNVPAPFGGFVSPVTGFREIFINNKGKYPLMFVFGHELTHIMQMNYPKLYNKYLAEFEGKLNFKLGPKMENYSKSLAKEEIASLVGNEMLKPEWWKSLATSEPSIFKRFATTVIDWMKKITSKLLSYPPTKEAYPENWGSMEAKLQENIKAALVEFAKGRKAEAEKLSQSLFQEEPGVMPSMTRPGYTPPPRGLLPAVRADGEIFAGTEGHTGIATNPDYMAKIEASKDVKMGWVDPDGKFYDNVKDAREASDRLFAESQRDPQSAASKTIENLRKQLPDETAVEPPPVAGEMGKHFSEGPYFLMADNPMTDAKGPEGKTVWNSIKDFKDKYTLGIKGEDLKWAERLYMLPWHIGQKFQNFRKLIDVQLNRDEAREQMNHEMVQKVFNESRGNQHEFLSLPKRDAQDLFKLMVDSDDRNKFFGRVDKGVIYRDEPSLQKRAQEVLGKELSPDQVSAYYAWKQTMDKAWTRVNDTHESAMFWPYEDKPYYADLKNGFREYMKSKSKGTFASFLESNLGTNLFRKGKYSEAEMKEIVRAADRMEKPASRLKELRADMGRWQYYVPRVREKGDYVIRGYDGDGAVKVSARAVDQFRGKRALDRFEKEYPGLRWESAFEPNTSEQMYQKVSDMHLEHFINKAMERAKKKESILPEDADAVRDALFEAVADDLKARGFASHFIMREEGAAIKGYETENGQKVFYDYMTGLSGFLTKQRAAFDFLKAMEGIDPKKQPVLFDEAATYISDMLRNSDRVDKLSGKIRSAAFAWYLSGSVKAAAVQFTQNFVTGVPFLGRVTKNPLKKYVQAMKDVGTKHYSEEEKKFIQEMHEKGIDTAQYLREVRGKMRGVAGGTWDKISQVLSAPFSGMEVFNREAASLAMFRVARQEQGKSYQEAFNQARDYVYNTHYLYGKANLPGFARGGDPASRVLRMSYTFRSFNHNFLLSLAQSLQSPEGRLRMDVIGRTLAYLTVLGGATSIPFLDDLVDGLEKMTGKSYRSDMRKALRGVGGDVLEKFGMEGLPAVLGADISGSMKVGLPKLSLRGTEEAIYGVYGGLIDRGMKAMDAFEKADIYRGVEHLSPSFIGSGMKAYRTSTEGARTASGKLMRDELGKPVTLGTGEAALQSLGFAPTRTSVLGKEKRVFGNVETYFKDKKEDLYAMLRTAKGKDRASVLRQVQDYNLEAQRYKGAIPMITREMIDAALREGPDKRFSAFERL